MQAAALVEPASLARAATSGSAMKQTAFAPSLPKPILLMPVQAMLVSVTMVAPFCSASRALLYYAVGEQHIAGIIKICGGMDNTLNDINLLGVDTNLPQLLTDNFHTTFFNVSG